MTSATGPILFLVSAHNGLSQRAPACLTTSRACSSALFGSHRERTLRPPRGDRRNARAGDLPSHRRRGRVDHTTEASGHSHGEVLQASRHSGAVARGIEPDVPEVTVAVSARLPADHIYRDISYRESGAVGYLQFEFYNGAMSTDQCRRLQDPGTASSTGQRQQPRRARGAARAPRGLTS
jgi:putative two-component system hydrogenase maturation factor HypX/HoxX